MIFIGHGMPTQRNIARKFKRKEVIYGRFFKNCYCDVVQLLIDAVLTNTRHTHWYGSAVGDEWVVWTAGRHHQRQWLEDEQSNEVSRTVFRLLRARYGIVCRWTFHTQRQ